MGVTAQDQQSRADLLQQASDWICENVPTGTPGATTWAQRLQEAARALPAGMEPVAEIVECRVMGQQTVAEVDEAWKFLPIGTKLYTAAQVQAMLEHGGAGRGAESEGKQPQTRMDASAHPGAELPPDQSPCRLNPLYHGPSNCLMGTVGCSVDSHRGRGRPPAAPATTEPQAPTTGAGSATAGAAPAYRLLQRDIDTIQADDEFLRDDAVTWQADPRGIFVGMAYMSNVLRPARRAIESCPEIK